MGNYLFKTDVPMKTLKDTDDHGRTYFGQHLLPRMMRGNRTFAYTSAANKVSGIKFAKSPGTGATSGTSRVILPPFATC